MRLCFEPVCVPGHRKVVSLSNTLLGIVACLVVLPVVAWGLDIRRPANQFVARGLPYRELVGVEGGTAPYRFEVLDGPDGLRIEAESGLITWQPDEKTRESSGAFAVTVRVSDGKGATAEETFQLITHDLIPLGSPLPAFRSSVVWKGHLICAGQYGITVRRLSNTMAVLTRIPFRPEVTVEQDGSGRVQRHGDRMVVAWGESVALFGLSAAGAPVLEGSIPAGDDVDAVAVSERRMAYAAGDTLRVLRLDDGDRFRREFSFDARHVGDIRFLKDGLLARADAKLIFLERQGDDWNREPVTIGRASQIMAIQSNRVAYVADNDLRVAQFPAGKNAVIVEGVGEADLARGATWDEDGLVLAGPGRRFLFASRTDGFEVEQDKNFDPKSPLIVIGGELLKVQGPTCLTGVDAEQDNEPLARTTKSPGDAGFLLGWGEDIHLGLGKGSLGWCSDGHVGLVRNVLEMDPVMTFVTMKTPLENVVGVHAIGAGVAVRTRKGELWWYEPAGEGGPSVNCLLSPEAADSSKRPLRGTIGETVAINNRLVGLSPNERGRVWLIREKNGKPQVNSAQIQPDVERLVGDPGRGVVFGLSGNGTIHASLLRDGGLSRRGSIQMPGTDSVATAVVGKRLVRLGRDEFSVIDSGRLGSLELTKRGKMRWMLPRRGTASCGPITFVHNGHNAGEGLLAMQVDEREDGTTEVVKVARRKLFRDSSSRNDDALSIQAVGGLILADSEAPLLLASDGGFRGRHPEASPSVTARSASALARAHALHEGGKRNEAQQLIDRACDVSVPGGVWPAFEYWSVVWKVGKGNPGLLAGYYIDDHVGVHLNSHASRHPNDDQVSTLRRTVRLGGFMDRYQEKWVTALANGSVDPVSERILWHVTASDEFCAPAFRALTEWGSPGARAVLLEYYPEAPPKHVPELTRVLLDDPPPKMREMIIAQWKRIGEESDALAPKHRRELVEVLGDDDLRMFSELLLPMLQSNKTEHVAEAARLTGLLGDPAGEEPLRRLLEDKEKDGVRGWAALGLLRLVGKTDWEGIEAGLATRDEELARSVVEFLRQEKVAQSDEAVKLIRSILRDRAWDKESHSIRYHALLAMRSLGRRDDLRFLNELDADQNALVANAVHRVRNAIRVRLEKDVADVPLHVGQKEQARASEEDYRRALAGLKDAAWEKQDPREKTITWFGIDGGVALANQERRQVRVFTDLFGITDLTINAIAFGQKRVWLATSHGLMAYDRKAYFWSRFAPTTAALDWPVRKLQFGDGGVLHVTFGEGGDGQYIFRTGEQKWVKGK